MNHNNSYGMLLELYKELEFIDSIRSVLYWDLNTHIPPAGVSYRTEQFGYLSKLQHQLLTSDRFLSLLQQSINIKDLSEEQERNVFLLKRHYDAATALPPELVSELSKQSNKTLEIWKRAKRKQDFSLVAPEMEKLFELNLRQAELLAAKKGVDDPFDALIEQRDEGFSRRLLQNLFSDVKQYLVPFVKRFWQFYQTIDTSFLSRNIPRKRLEMVIKNVLTFLQYKVEGDKAFGRVDEVEHPLTISCGPEDVRVTVRYHPENPMFTFFGATHECGHALHSLQGKKEWLHQPIYYYHSPSLGESQSRFIENIITKSSAFWHFYYPTLQELTGVYADIDLEQFYLAINTVKPSFIRTEADEVTYILHIIIRFEIEQDLFDSKLSIKELPEIWNEHYQEYLGITVPNDTVGVMQDLHWYSQFYGYFFGYGIGDLIAAQLLHTMATDLQGWEEDLIEGNFTSIRHWLKENIHQYGGLYPTLELVRKITGETLQTRYHKQYLENKYKSIVQ